jgi:LysM repeat protein
MPSPILTHVASLALVAATPVGGLATDDYVVRPGDTTTAIAARYGVSVQTLVQANRLPAGGNLIYAGETLTIPAAHSRGTPTASTAPAEPDDPAPTLDEDARRTVWHTVRPGDTVTGLAARYHAWTDELIEVNHLGPAAAITVGQRLRIPVVVAALPRNREHATRPGRDGSGGSGGPAPESRATGDPSHAQVRRIIERTANRYGVDPQLALAISWQEAGWQQHHVSSAHAIGAMQVLPSTGRWISTVLGRPLALRDVHDNVTAGVVLLRELDRMADKRRVVVGYYQGLASVRDNGMYRDTRRYVRNVLALESQFEQGLYPY